MLSLALATAAGSTPAGSGTSIASAYGTRTRSGARRPSRRRTRRSRTSRARRHRRAVAGLAAPAAGARAAGDLERHDDAVAGRDGAHLVADLDSPRRRTRGRSAIGPGIGASPRTIGWSRSHSATASGRTSASPGPCERRRRDLPPLDLAVGGHRELLHQASGGCRSGRSWRPASRSTSASCRARASTSAPSSAAMVRSARRAASLAVETGRLQALAQGRQPALEAGLHGRADRLAARASPRARWWPPGSRARSPRPRGRRRAGPPAPRPRRPTDGLARSRCTTAAATWPPARAIASAPICSLPPGK